MRQMKTTKKKFVDNLALVGVIYYCRFKVDRKPIERSTGCTTKEAAKLKLAEFRLEEAKLAKARKDKAEKKHIPTFSEAVDLWYNARVGKKTLKHLNNIKNMMQKHFIPLIGNILVDAITIEVLQIPLDKYLNGYNSKFTTKKHCIGGYNTMIAFVNSIMGSLVPSYLASPVFVKKEKLQKKKKPFVPKSKISQFLQEVDKHNVLHQSVAIRAMLYMGLREDEALNMKWDNIDYENMEYCPGGIVGSDDTTKGKEASSVIINNDMLVWLNKCPKVDGCPYVLPSSKKSRKNLPHNAQYTNDFVHRAGTVIGLKLSPHRLRGTFCTLLHKQGTPIGTIKEMMRHQDIETTMSYIETGIEDAHEAASKLWDNLA